MRILFAGGGTAGHINPALAIANYISDVEPSEIAFVGTSEGLEAELIPRLGYDLSLIKVHGFDRSLSLRNLRNMVELPKSVSDSKKIIKKFKPDIAIGTGGYVSGPLIYAAAKMKVPTIVHEANAYPGITTRMLSRYADTVALGAKAAEPYIKSPKHMIYTGNPVRPSILSVSRAEARRKLGIDERPFIVFFGGSLGARDFNRAVVDWISKVVKEDEYRIMMGTGKLHQYDTVCSRFKENGIDIEKYPSLSVCEYIYDMDIVMTAADLCVCRAGASTLSELTALGKPSILVPSPNVTANHQEHNARAVEKVGGAKVILESELTAEVLGNTVESLAGDEKRLFEMAKCAKKSGTTTASQEIYEEAKRLIAVYKAK